MKAVARFGVLLFFGWCAASAAAQEPGGASKVPNRPKQNQTFAQETAQPSASLAGTESALRRQIEQSPSNPDLLYRLALLLREEHKYSESLQTYTRAAALQKPSAMQLRSVALDYVLLGDYDDAIRWLRVALSMEPDNIDILYSLGRCAYTQNIFPQAEAAFTRILQLKPDHLKAMENLGLTYDGENKPQLAERALRTAATWAAQQNLRDEWPYLDLAAFLLDQSRAAEALPFLQKAVTIAPDSAQTNEKLGRALLGLGKPADAIPALEKAALLDPQNPKAHFELGRAYRDSGQADKARAEFAVSKTLYGNHSRD